MILEKIFGKIIERKVLESQKEILEAVKVVNNQKFADTHKVCDACHITGHTVDMKEVWDWTEHAFYHNGCYAAKFDKHFCPCGCGKWIENKKKKHK